MKDDLEEVCLHAVVPRCMDDSVKFMVSLLLMIVGFIRLLLLGSARGLLSRCEGFRVYIHEITQKATAKANEPLSIYSLL